MLQIEKVRQLALAFEEAEEHPHFDIPSFRVRKKIFATLRPKENIAMLRLSLVNQQVFCAFGQDIFYPVPGAWGRQGATFVNLKKVRQDMFKDALTEAYCLVAPVKLAAKYKKD